MRDIMHYGKSKKVTGTKIAQDVPVKQPKKERRRSWYSTSKVLKHPSILEGIHLNSTK